MLDHRKRKNPREDNFFARIKKQSFPRKKILRRVLYLLLFSLIFYLYFAGDYGFIRLLSLKAEKENTILETKRLQALNLDLQIEKEKLRNDLSYIEKIARERYGMAKKDEIIYKFVQPQDSSSTPLTKNR
jgi:cell division protein FtsB